MQRDTEQASLPSSSSEEGLVLRQKPTTMQVRDKGDVTLQQWKEQQLQRLAEELKAEWQGARLHEVRDMERLYVAHLLDEATGRALGHDLNSDELYQRRTARHMRAKERSRAAFRGEKGRREEHPRHHHKSRKKATCSQRRGSTKARRPNSSEKGKGKRVSSSKSNGGYQPLGPRASRAADLAKLNPLLSSAEEIECMEEVQKEISREGRRLIGRETSRFTQIINYNSKDRYLRDKTPDLEEPLSSTFKQEATPQVSQCKCGGKNQWHKEIESAFEELFNTNRKLKKQLNLHLVQRLKANWNPDEQQSYLDTQGENSDTLKEERAVETETVDSGSPVEPKVRETWSKNSLKELLSEVEYPRYQQMAKYPLKSESMMVPVPKAEPPGEQDDLFSGSPLSEQEPPKPAEVEEKPVDSVASWIALRRKKAELEQRRQKTLLEMTEHPDMSLEIHYHPELEEERRERRRMRLAILKSYSTGAQPPGSNHNISLDSCLLDEEKQNQMIHDLQQHILEQSNLHKQFLEKARKRLQEFQKTF
nr:protein DDC8 homolog [Meriones unguiculatus]